jgi:transcriptional regulator of acetoin/glycerol metabolism
MTQFDTEKKDVLLAAAIASGTSASAAARQMDLSLSTVQRRMADPDFRKLVGS